MAFTISDFQKMIPANLVKAGERLFKNDAVKSISNPKENEWTAEVLDKETFNVEILLDDERNILDHFCDCPTESEHCQHQVAALLKLRQILPHYEKKQTKTKKEKEVKVKKKTDPISQILEEVSLAELREFVQKAAATQKEFKNMLLVHFSEKSESNNRKYYTDVLRTSLSNVKRSGSLNVKDTKRFLPAAEQLWKKAQDSLQKGNLKDASPILLAIIETLTQQNERLSDSNGVVNQIIQNTYYELTKLIEKSPFEFQKALAEELFEVLEPNMSFYYNHFRNLTFDLLRLFNRYPDLHLTYVQFLDKVLKQPNLNSETNSSFWSYSSSSFESTLESEMVTLKRRLYEAQKQDDKIPALLARFQHIDKFRKEYVEYCLTTKDYPEARKVLEKFLSDKSLFSEGASVNKFWFETLLKVCQLQKDVQGQINTLRLQFAITGYEKISLLPTLKQLCTPDQWNTLFAEFKKATLKQINELQQYGYFGFRDIPKPFPVKTANLLVFDERWQELWDLLSSQKTFDSYGIYGKHLAQAFPEQLYSLYKNNIRKWIDDASSMDNYRAIVAILVTLSNLSIEGKELAENQVNHIRIAHKRKYQFLSLLKEVGF
jgi:hypothetical protein